MPPLFLHRDEGPPDEPAIAVLERRFVSGRVVPQQV